MLNWTNFSSNLPKIKYNLKSQLQRRQKNWHLTEWTSLWFCCFSHADSFYRLANALVQKFTFLSVVSFEIILSSPSIAFVSQTCDCRSWWRTRRLECSQNFSGCLKLTAKQGGNNKVSLQELLWAPISSVRSMRWCCRRWTCSCLSYVHSSQDAVQPGIWKRNRENVLLKIVFKIQIYTTYLHLLFTFLSFVFVS